MGNATQVAKSSLASKMGEGKKKKVHLQLFLHQKKIIPGNQMIHLFHGFPFQPLRIFGLTCPFFSVKSQLQKTQPMSGQALHNLNCRVPVAMPCHAFKSSASAVGETKISGSTFKVSKGGVTGSSFLSQLRFHCCCPVTFWQETALRTCRN